ncbi:tRNA pseudouridine(38-40) synthase TruA [Vampirovibrio sp.]|uniref:tRNA pseudouridine(38-40) synthase TruA n=1 Tax=Vampirovibrio sp. TaxID=2717857 RepID=UPI003592FD6F
MTDVTVQSNYLQPEESDSIIRIALLVEYCGQFFHGSQFQPHLQTVQSSVQDGLRKLNLKTSAVSFAGRTDAGVNAHGQVAHFDIAKEALINVQNLPAALNAQLPDSVAIRDCCLTVSKHFHSRRDAQYKWYRYRIYNGRNRTALMGPDCMHYAKPVNAERMNQAAQLLLGAHNFKSFKDSDSPITNDICDIRHIQVSRDQDFINFDVAADRFLYKMVRNIAGQLLFIGNTETSQSPENILDVLAEQDRSKAAFTARPEGLSLMAIIYPSPFNYFESDLRVRQLTQLFKLNQMESLQNENLFRKAS